MYSNKRCSPWRGFLAAVVLLPALAVAAPVTHCKPDDKVFFSCVAGKKTVSLCGQAGASGLASLTYRYGLPGKVENEYAATPANGKSFLGTVEPDSPHAEIREIWFDLGEFRYLLTSCLGGDCPYGGGLAVLKHGKVLSSLRCAAGLDSLTAFSGDLVEFGDGVEGSKSHTPLLKLDDYTNKIEQLYPIPVSAYP
jgi:hypothetical protein